MNTALFLLVWVSVSLILLFIVKKVSPPGWVECWMMLFDLALLFMGYSYIYKEGYTGIKLAWDLLTTIPWLVLFSGVAIFLAATCSWHNDIPSENRKLL